MSLPQSFMDELRARIGLAALIGRRVRLQRKGREHTGLCPFHNEKTPSFTVNEDKGFYHCFGCGAHGDAISFVMQSEGLSFPDAVERLAAEAGLEVPKPSPEAAAAAARQASLLEVVEAAAKAFEAALAATEGREARGYLEDRGLRGDTIAAFRLGFAPERRGFLSERLGAEGIKPEQMIEAGLAKRDEQSGLLREYFFGRVIFPIADRRGRIVGFGGRRMGEGGPKYLNSPDGPLFHKGQLLYNLGRAGEALRKGESRLLLVEGYMDVIALAQAGIAAAVAPLGTAVTEAQLETAWRLVDEPTLCLDGDEAGRRAANRLADRALPILKPGKSLSCVFLPEGEDPDSLVRKQGRQALESALGRDLPLAELVWRRAFGAERPRTPERWAALKSLLLNEAGRVGDASVQESYRAFLMDRYYETRRQGRAGPARGRDSARRPASLGRKPDPQTHHLRQERELMALLLNHPAQAAAREEDLALMELQSSQLDRLKSVTIDALADHPELDREALQRQLSSLGYAALVDQVLSSAVYALCAAARPEAPEDQAGRMLETLLANFAKGRAVHAVEEAQARLAADPNEQNLACLQAAQRELDAADRRIEALAAA